MNATIGKLLAAVLVVATASPALAAQVDRREARQQARIAEGIEHGQLTPRETARLEHQEARVHRQIRRERVAHGGRLTRVERRRIHREQNHLSREIRHERHDRQHM
jgi:hypothetical protein